MRKQWARATAALLTLGLMLAAGEARAAVLGYTGTLSIQILALDPVTLLGSGTAVVNGSNGSGHLTALSLGPSGFATAGFGVPVTDPIAFPIVGIQATLANASGVFAGSGNAGFGGVMPINGGAIVCLFGGGCSSAGGNLTVPLSVVGAGGAAVVTGAVNLTVIGAPWTTGTVAVGTLTAMGSAGPNSNTGNASGVVTLVTPIFISTNIGPAAVIPAFGVLSLHFVPEPGTLALLGAGIAGFVAFGRARRHR